MSVLLQRNFRLNNSKKSEEKSRKFIENFEKKIERKQFCNSIWRFLENYKVNLSYFSSEKATWKIFKAKISKN